MLALQKMQAQINILQEQAVHVNQMISQADNAYQNLASPWTVLRAAKTDEFYEKIVCSWLQSLDSYFAAQGIEPCEK